MKTLLESLITRKNLNSRSKVTVNRKMDLKNLIVREINRGNTDLNFIDVSNIRDMSDIFWGIKTQVYISDWDVSEVTNMRSMFQYSEFNDSISDWDVSNVKNMMRMFAFSTFSQDISSWKINPKCTIENMFLECPIPEKFKPIGTL